MILLHLLDDSSILMHPKYMLYVERFKHHTAITYRISNKDQYICVKETPEEITEILHNFYITF